MLRQHVLGPTMQHVLGPLGNTFSEHKMLRQHVFGRVATMLLRTTSPYEELLRVHTHTRAGNTSSDVFLRGCVYVCVCV
jgi:hypothetical protein